MLILTSALLAIWSGLFFTSATYLFIAVNVAAPCGSGITVAKNERANN